MLMMLGYHIWTLWCIPHIWTIHCPYHYAIHRPHPKRSKRRRRRVGGGRSHWAFHEWNILKMRLIPISPWFESENVPQWIHTSLQHGISSNLCQLTDDGVLLILEPSAITQFPIPPCFDVWRCLGSPSNPSSFPKPQVEADAGEGAELQLPRHFWKRI